MTPTQAVVETVAEVPRSLTWVPMSERVHMLTSTAAAKQLGPFHPASSSSTTSSSFFSSEAGSSASVSTALSSVAAGSSLVSAAGSSLISALGSSALGSASSRSSEAASSLGASAAASSSLGASAAFSAVASSRTSSATGSSATGSISFFVSTSSFLVQKSGTDCLLPLELRELIDEDFLWPLRMEGMLGRENFLMETMVAKG
mmetsp:Transcript_17547/g.50226  ORF Transcript_17547/g.50226 Transcript_17547/m.50226 type:complete len:203 (+) Transcript_17547:1356-1964(+)